MSSVAVIGSGVVNSSTVTSGRSMTRLLWIACGFERDNTRSCERPKHGPHRIVHSPRLLPPGNAITPTIHQSSAEDLRVRRCLYARRRAAMSDTESLRACRHDKQTISTSWMTGLVQESRQLTSLLHSRPANGRRSLPTVSAACHKRTACPSRLLLVTAWRV